MITGDPEVGRLKWQGRIPADVMTSEREAVIGAEHFEAAEGESTKTFHARMCEIARERGKFDRLVGVRAAATAETVSRACGDREGSLKA